MSDNRSDSNRQRILVVDDDEDARWLAADALNAHGFAVSEAAEGTAVLDSIDRQTPDLVVLDLGLPGIGGLEVLRQIRAAGALPVIIVTGRGDRADRISGLELGADDYVVKPFDGRELVARVNAVLRRSNTTTASPVLDFGELVINPVTRDVTLDERLVELTAKEFDLLAFLASSPRQVFTREQILERVWGSSTEWQDPSTVNEHVHRLRRKIESDHAKPRWIVTKRGVGYRFSPDRGSKNNQ